LEKWFWKIWKELSKLLENMERIFYNNLYYLSQKLLRRRSRFSRLGRGGFVAVAGALELSCAGGSMPPMAASLAGLNRSNPTITAAARA
jgi:hypothetical protein